MIISRPEPGSRCGNTEYRTPVEVSGRSAVLWFSLSEEFAGLVSGRSDAPLLALLIPAMVRGEDIHIEGTVSEKLFFNVSGPLQNVLKHIIPSLHLIRITASDIRPASHAGNGVAAGFSAGIDSFCLLADHHFADVPKGFRITHLLFNNVGSHGSDERESTYLFHKRFNRIRPVAERIGLPFIMIDSNMDSFYHDLNFQATHTLRNASVALLLQGGIRRFLYATSVDYSHAGLSPAGDICSSDAITLPLLSTETLDMVSAGGQYTRVEKTLKVAEIKESYNALDVCTKDSRMTNCSSCFKCKRTMLTLEIAGVLDRYAGVFDLDCYKKIRNRYIAEVLSGSGDHPYSGEIASFMREKDFETPVLSRLPSRSGLNNISRRAKRLANIPLKWGKNKRT